MLDPHNIYWNEAELAISVLYKKKISERNHNMMKINCIHLYSIGIGNETKQLIILVRLNDIKRRSILDFFIV